MQKTTLVEKRGYGFASLGDATAYGFIGVYLLFFLTTIAGISPGVAGTIAAIGAVWNAIVNPVMGYIADKGGWYIVFLVLGIIIFLSLLLCVLVKFLTKERHSHPRFVH